MKKHLFSLLLVLGFLTSLHAQMTRGHVHYAAEISAGDNPSAEIEMLVGIMEGSTMDVYFDDSRSRVEMSIGGLLFQSSTISDTDSGDVLMLVQNPMGKYAVRTTVEQLELETDEVSEASDQDIQLLDESKEIAGFVCKKAILTTKKGGEKTFWYTDQIETSLAGGSNLDKRVPGTSLEIEAVENGVHMKYTATEVSGDLEKEPEELFTIEVPDGFEEMSLEEYMLLGN